LRGLKVEGVTARLRCIEHYKERRGNKTSYGTRPKGEWAVTLCAPTTAVSGGVIGGSGEVVVEEAYPPTSADRVGYPYYTWEVVLQTSLAGAADYVETFVVEVV
jgi:hypothetical protein